MTFYDLCSLKLRIFLIFSESLNFWIRSWKNCFLKKVSDLLTFLQYYVRFADPAYSVKFEESIASLSDKSATMGIQEMIIDRARKEGLQQGLETAKTSIVKNLILTMTVSDSQIAAIAEVPVAFVKNIRQELGK